MTYIVAYVNVSNVNLENTSPIASIVQCFQSGKCLHFANLYPNKANVNLSLSATPQVDVKEKIPVVWSTLLMRGMTSMSTFLCNTYCQFQSFHL